MKVFTKKDYRPGSANFESHFLEFTQDAVRVRPSLKLLFFYGIFAQVGLFIITVPLYAQADSGDAVWGVLLFGLIFLGAGGGMIAATVRRNYPQIDFNQGLFYPAGINQRKLADESPAIPLNEIEEILMSSRIVSGRKNRYRCYTLSLKFTGDREFILLNHGSLKAFLRDAGRLGEQLRLPLPENEFEERIAAANAQAAPFVLIFSLIWLVISSSIHFQTWQMQDMIPRIFTGIFVLVGLILFFTALKQLLSRRRRSRDGASGGNYRKDPDA